MKVSLKSYAHNHIWKIIIFLILLAANVYIFYKTFKIYNDKPEYFYLHNMLGCTLCISRGSAAAICLNTAAVIISMCKKFTSCISKILDEKKSMHIICGIFLCFLSVIHTAAHCVNNYFFCNNFDEKNLDINVFTSKEKVNVTSIFFRIPGITGILMLIILVLMLISSMTSKKELYNLLVHSPSCISIPWITHPSFIWVREFYHETFPGDRRKYGDFLAFLLKQAFQPSQQFFCIIKRQTNLEEHRPGCKYLNISSNLNLTKLQLLGDNVCRSPPKFEHDPAQGWKWIIFPLVCYFIDRVIRSWRGSKCVEIKKVIWHSGDVVELHLIQNNFKAIPGQYVQMQCPEIAHLEWHPFTITKCPSKNVPDDYFSLHIKVLGQWTERLSSRLLSLCKQEAGKQRQTELIFSNDKQTTMSHLVQSSNWPRISIDGPYGGPCQDVTKYSVSVCIAAGIGVTPFAAVINSLRQKLNQGKIRRLYFIWISRDVDSFHWFLELLYSFHKEMMEKNKPDFFICKFYLTRDEEISAQDHSLSDNFSTEWLKSRLHLGRPSWKEIFNQISQNHRRTQLGVFYTGPKCISPVIKRTCDRPTSYKNSFIFHKDSFG
eukprot:gene435-1076_t